MRRNQKCVLLLLALPMPFFIFIAVQQNWCCEKKESLVQRSSSFFSDGLDLNLLVSEEDEELKDEDDQDDFSLTHKDAEKSVEEICAENPNLPTSLKDLTKQQRTILLGHLMVNDEYKFMYCYTPKVACSNWKKVIKRLYGNLREEDMVRMDHHHGFTYLSEYTDEQIEERLRTYYKFMFVRNPTERVISVYRNKFNQIESFYKVYGSRIMSMYHKESPTYKGKVPGDDVPFADFLRYISTGVEAEKMNEHYMPMTTLCQPCLVKYSFIGIYDRITEDSETVLRSINAPEDVHFPERQVWYKPTKDSYLHYYFSLVSSSLLDSFVSKYNLDYTMFSFPKPYFVKTDSPYLNRTFHLR